MYLVPIIVLAGYDIVLAGYGSVKAAVKMALNISREYALGVTIS